MAGRLDERRRAAIEEHRRALQRMIDRQAAAGQHAGFDAGMGELTRALARAFKGRGRDPVTAASAHELAMLAGRGVADIFASAAQMLAAGARLELGEGISRLARLLHQVSGKPGALDDFGTMLQAGSIRRAEVEALRRRAMMHSGAQAAVAVRRQVMSTPLDGSARVNGAIQEALQTCGDQYFRVERTAKTECAYAFNAAQDEGIAAVAREDLGIMKRWTELVSDDGQPLDKAVSIDSIVMHGQVAEPGGLFIMPDDPRLPPKLVGKSWQHPPNRPHDRAVLLPWRREWGIPGWIVRGGERRSA